MLRVLRQTGIGQALMGAIVLAIIAVFLLEFRSTSRMKTGSIKRECAVRIDGDCLTPKDYYAAFGLIVPREVPAKQVKALGLRKQVLDGIIERELLVAEAHRLGLSVDDEAVKEELRKGRAHVSLPADTALRTGLMLNLVSADETGITRDLVRELPVIDAKTQEVDDDLYSRVVRSMTNRSPKEFLKMQERELLAARMRDLVRARVRVSEEEAYDAFMREKSKAVIRFVKLDEEWFARWAVDASNVSTDRWAEAHKAPVDDAWKAMAPKWKAGCPLVSEIVGSFPPDASEADKTLAKDKLDRAKGLLSKGHSFESVARELSDGPSAFTGGQVGCLSAEAYGEGADVLLKSVEGLADGATTGIVETKNGYHLVRVDGHLAAGDVETIGRRTAARPLAVRGLAVERAKEFATKLIQAAQGGARLDDTVAKLLPEFATAAEGAKGEKKKDDKGGEASSDEASYRQDPHVPKMEISAPFGVDGDPIPGAFGVPVARMAFELAKPDDVKPEPIALGADLAVIQLKEKTVPTREDFATAKPEIVRRLEIGKRADALARYVARLRQAKQEKIEISERILEEPKSAESD